MKDDPISPVPHPDDDRLTDALLREHARLGTGDDAAFLKKLESALAEINEADSPITAEAKPARWSPMVWLAAAAAVAAMIVAWPKAGPPAVGSDLARQDPAPSAPTLTADPVVSSRADTPEEVIPPVAGPVIAEANVQVPQEEKSEPPVPPMDGTAALLDGSSTPAEPMVAEARRHKLADDSGGKPAESEGGLARVESDSMAAAAAPLARPSVAVAPSAPPPPAATTVPARGAMIAGSTGREAGGAGGGGAGFGHAVGMTQRGPGGWLPPHERPMPMTAPVDRERYGQLIDNPWRSPADEALSTFSIDVDTASYANFRRLAGSGGRIPPDAIRLEEMVNYFDYSYPQPADGQPFAVALDAAVSPWNPETRLVRVAIQGHEVKRTERAPANLVFLLDVSGSMNEEDKLPLVARSFQLLLEEMNAADTLSIVVYAGAEGLALPPTKCDTAGRERVAEALKKLKAGGSTNGGAGISLAYKLARENFKEGGINRVILATDGDFNVGVTEDGGLVSLVEKNARSRVFLTVLGFGAGNLNDGMLEAITNKGNGTYHYIDSINEARRVFLQKMMGTLVTIAKDVKIQVEFNPAMVSEYRLLGYANRMLAKEDFNNDRVDAGDIGAGHTVTAFYEIRPGPAKAAVDALKYQPGGNPGGAPEPAAARLPDDAAAEWMQVKLRYKEPEGDTSRLITRPFAGPAVPMAEAGDDFRFAAAVAMVASSLRDTEGFGPATLADARAMAAAAKGNDPHGLRAEFIGLIDRLKTGEKREDRRDR